MHTPEEARQLWCPMVRAPRVVLPNELSDAFVVGGCNADTFGRDRIPRECRCVADRCAMWRWEHTTESVPVTIQGPSGRATTYEQRATRTHGYCGLAGRPFQP